MQNAYYLGSIVYAGLLIDYTLLISAIKQAGPSQFELVFARLSAAASSGTYTNDTSTAASKEPSRLTDRLSGTYYEFAVLDGSEMDGHVSSSFLSIHEYTSHQILNRPLRKTSKRDTH